MKILGTKQMAQQVAPILAKDLPTLLSQAAQMVAASGEITLNELRTGRNAKHLAKVVGNAVIRALVVEGFDLANSHAGVTSGASQATERLASKLSPSNDIEESDEDTFVEADEPDGEDA